MYIIFKLSFFYSGLLKKNGTTTPGSITTSGNDICMDELNHDAAKIERLLQDKIWIYSSKLEYYIGWRKIAAVTFQTTVF